MAINQSAPFHRPDTARAALRGSPDIDPHPDISHTNCKQMRGPGK